MSITSRLEHLRVQDPSELFFPLVTGTVQDGGTLSA